MPKIIFYQNHKNHSILYQKQNQPLDFYLHHNFYQLNLPHNFIKINSLTSATQYINFIPHKNLFILKSIPFSNTKKYNTNIFFLSITKFFTQFKKQPKNIQLILKKYPQLESYYIMQQLIN